MNLFKNLANLSYKRNIIEALVFYIVYLCVIVAISSVFTTIVGTFTQSNSLLEATIVSSTITFVLNIVLAFSILKAKNITDDFTLILFAIFSGLLTLVGGSILGVLVAAYFSILKPGKK